MQIKKAQALVSVIFAATCLTAQASVLDLQKDYHVGWYGASIDIPNGNLGTGSSFGVLSLTAAGGATFTVDTMEATPQMTQMIAQVIAANYTVQANGEIILSFANGPDLPMWITPDGSTMHSTRSVIDTEALSIYAIETSTNASSATLNGDYYYVSHVVAYNSGTWETFGEWGTINFNGAGAATVNGSQLHATTAGSSTSPLSYSATYAVAPDGSMVFDGEAGAVSADGELAFMVLRGLQAGEVALTIAVKVGSAYDHNNLVGRYSLTDQTINVFPTSNPLARPRTITGYGELSLGATTSTTGSWGIDTVVIDGTQQAVVANQESWNGTSTLSTGGALVLADQSAAWDLFVSQSGRYVVGRIVEPSTNLSFAMRQAPVCNAYGTGTAGTGGVTPTLSMKTFPALGNSNWAFAVEDGIGGGIGVVAVATSPSPGLPALGGLIWVNPLTVGYSGLVLLNGTAGGAGTGTGTVALPIPNTSALAGLELFGQAMLLDNAGAQGFSLSSGFRAQI